ncbi:tRNA 4-thiouridine(8) synthase ThiI [Arhodomonas aquaeolei]|uniref:tRNA uracil 4-sulfurtransferase ThiI n=1 Tax=Arhodomonas aquaeolei TaxID=2369 RepID=UPI00216A2CA6|nr:tRNA uracil 4-sulfurtransferase ThiI [Arhodomonas aquaeolei]MCS4504520.1 tRNA 4-thiouridine(8) synthase ThiI [Arhodomonas aquaeolei]
MNCNRILVHYAEVALKGRNRRDFESRLKRNIKIRLQSEGLDWEVHRGRDRITVHPRDPNADALERALEAVGETAGVATFAPAVFFPRDALYAGGDGPDVDAIESAALAQAAEPAKGRSFAVRVNRADKGFPLTSEAFARRLGARIIETTSWQHVDLRRPDRAIHVDIYPEGVYVYHDRRRGPGGLPVFSGGHVLSLLSGGMDSPVAAWMMAKRGCRVDFLHMTATHLRPEDAGNNLVARIAAHLSRFTLRSRLLLVPYTHFDLALTGQDSQGYDMILFRRFMTRLAEHVAANLHASALVSGDSLGQVASQTLANMVSTSQAGTVPILRPLVGLDKHEIIERARDIGTFDMGTEQYKDCCALLSRNPQTKSRHTRLEALETRLFPDYDGLIESSLADALMLTFETGRLTGVEPALSSLSDAG